VVVVASELGRELRGERARCERRSLAVAGEVAPDIALLRVVGTPMAGWARTLHTELARLRESREVTQPRRNDVSLGVTPVAGAPLVPC
jgi:hypothetical protein